MVTQPRLVRWLLAVQLLAVLAYCFSHLATTLLRVTPPVFSSSVYEHAAAWGLNFLFLSSGFLVHLRRDALMPPGASWLSGTAAYLTSRFWFLALPCYAAYIFDVGVLSFRDFGQSPNLTLIALPLLTLSQTWLYTIIGDTSLGQPLNGANVAWVGSCLLFTSIFYAMTRGLWSRMPGLVAVGVLLLALAMQAGQYRLLADHAAGLLAYDAANFSMKNPDYSLYSYFLRFSPYSYLASFIAGVALAGVHQHGLLRQLPVQLILVGATAAGLVVSVQAQALYLCINLLLVLLLGWQARRLDDRAALASEAALASGPEGKSWQGLFAMLAGAAYTLVVLHLVMMLPFTSGAVDHASFAGKAYLTGRILVVTAMMMLLCTGLQFYIFEPLRRAILARLDVEAGDDRFI